MWNPSFVGPLWPNMLNMPKSASDLMLVQLFVLTKIIRIPYVKHVTNV